MATKYIKKIRRWQSTRLESKETLQNKDTASRKALRWSEDVLVRYFMILSPRAWIYKGKLSKLPVSNFFSNGTCFKAIFSFLTFFSKLFILTITWQYATWKSKISMHTLFSLLHCSPPAYSTYQILNHTSSKSTTSSMLHEFNYICKLKPWFPCKAKKFNTKWLGRALMLIALTPSLPVMPCSITPCTRPGFTAREWERSKRHHVSWAD